MKLAIGMTLTGKVVRKTTFGVFLALEGQTKEGLVHVSRLRGNSQDLRRQRLDEIELGDEMIVEISQIKKEGKVRKIALSEKLVHDDIVLRHLPLNEPIEGTVVDRTEYGVFVVLPTWHITGLLHVSKMDGSSKERHNRLHTIENGDALTVYVLEIERRGEDLKLSLSEQPLSASQEIEIEA